ncbi:hypothetical protein LCGC14_1289790 [marine sediment metagenome]|uniref:Uncharacterized protein n=1 Tax=marine sediment metagenome TaxID=412755 RepID=A0A0F9NVS3_9ZZZZ
MDKTNEETLAKSAKLATRFMGWSKTPSGKHWSYNEGRFKSLVLVSCWNPFKHRDDAAEVEAGLINANLVEAYTAKLCDLIDPIEGVPATFQLVTATARQRAEAIWAVLKKQKVV